MQWDHSEIEAYFGVTSEPASTIAPDSQPQHFNFSYAGSHLSYEIWGDVEKDQVAISGDTTTPFGGTSLYEIYVPCDLILLLHVAGYPTPALVVWYGPQSDLRNRRLSIYKRPDGDLVVWPVYPFPEGHASDSPMPEL